MTEPAEARSPVVQLPDGAWAVRGHAEVLEVATSPQVYSSRTHRHLHVPNGMDGEEHRRFRAVVDAHLADARILPLMPMITDVADRAAVRAGRALPPPLQLDCRSCTLCKFGA